MTKPYYRRCYPATWVEVPNARPVTISGWEHLELFVYQQGGECVVAEAHTGVWLGWDRLQRVALAKARLRLLGMGRAEVNRRIAYETTRYGCSPRYADAAPEQERREG